MKKIILVFCLVPAFHFLKAQSKTEPFISVPVEYVSVYQPVNKVDKHLKLEMDYGKSSVKNKKAAAEIKDAQIASVDLVYTDFPKGINLEKLNQQRLAELKKTAPQLFKDEKITWRMVAQTNCETKKDAENLFHGIVITYRPAPSPESMAAEVSYLKSFTEGIKPTDADKTEEIKESFESTLPVTITSSLITDGKLISTTTFTYPSLEDSTLFKVFDRNKNWNEKLIVMDVTGSMSPYTAQLFAWLKLNTIDHRIKQFIFFNDGDRTPDHKKIIGKTGGIYETRSADFTSVSGKVYEAMINGCGGDTPENNIEALLKGTELCPYSEDIILIADNWANVKDIELAGEIKKPVHIILCGTWFGINTQYLDLARITGGTVHTIEEDLNDLALLNEGETITLGGTIFKIIKGKFVKTGRA